MGKLVKNIQRIYKETGNRVKTEKGLTKQFWTEKGFRQGCPLSPLLFIIFIVNVKEYLKKRQKEGTAIGGMKIYTLAYANDI